MGERCLYTLLHADKENHEAILLEWAAPVARALSRLGIEVPAEAILRFFMHRLYEEQEVGAR